VTAGTTPPRAVTIAGSDPSGGAGVQADLVTFAALGVHGMGCVSALTVQDTEGVREVRAVEPELVAAQLAAVLADLGADAAKTGMLANAGVVEAVAATVREHGRPALVCDPVLASSGGVPLLDDAGVAALRAELLPLVRVLTPNFDEAAILLGWEPAEVARRREDACRALFDLGSAAVVLTGGHGAGAASEDLLHDGAAFVRLTAPRVDTRNTHGTGCAFSAALCAHLARGELVADAARGAKAFVAAALEGAQGRRLGRGRGPLDLGGALRGR